MQRTLIIVLAFAILVAVFSIQNAGPVSLSFFNWQFETSLVVVVLGAVALGAAMMGLFSSFKQIALKREIRKLSQKNVNLERINREIKNFNLELEEKIKELKVQDSEPTEEVEEAEAEDKDTAQDIED